MTAHEAIKKIKEALYMVEEVERCEVEHAIEKRKLDDLSFYLPTGYETITIKIRFK